MADTILVTPEELKNTAEEFRGIGSEARNLTQQMVSIINGLGSIYEGESATAFNNQFHKLDGDMETMHNNVTKQANHLNEIADKFSSEENKNVDESTGLPSNLFK